MKKPTIAKRIYRSGKIAYQVDLGGVKRRRKVFESEQDAVRYAEFAWRQLQMHGQSAFQLDAKQMKDASDALELLRAYPGITLKSVVEFYMRFHTRNDSSLCLSELTEKVLEEKERQGCRKSYTKDLQKRLSAFQYVIGDKKVSEVTKEDIKNWMRRDGVSTQTHANDQRNLSVMFGFAAREGIIPSNPMRDFKRPKIDYEPKILTVDESERLLREALKANDRLELLPVIALGLFCGVRTSELRQIEWDDIRNDEEDGLRLYIRKSIAKGRRIREIEIPENCREWLDLHKGERKGKIAPRNYAHRFTTLRRQAGFRKWEANAIRHSFASYFYRWTDSSEQTCARLGQRNDTVLFTHYRSVTSRSEARRYFELRPANTASQSIQGPYSAYAA